MRFTTAFMAYINMINMIKENSDTIWSSSSSNCQLSNTSWGYTCTYLTISFVRNLVASPVGKVKSVSETCQTKQLGGQKKLKDWL